MEMLINSSYLITIGTLIGYERTMRCKEQTSKEDKEKYRQIPFCTGICCVQTYRNLEKAQLEVKVSVYEQLLDKLGYQMNYDDATYKDINYRLRNLNDAIEKYDLDSVFLIVEKLNEVLTKSDEDIYFKYLKHILNVIYQYYKSNEFPSIEDVRMMKKVFVGYPIYLRDVIVDILFKYGLLNIIDDKDFDIFVEELNLSKNMFIPNQINDLQYLSHRLDLVKFYQKANELLIFLKQKSIFIRILDVYDLKMYADFYTNPMAINDDIEICQSNVNSLMEKLRISEENLSDIPQTMKKKLSQHYYHIGYILYMRGLYEDAAACFEKAINFDNILGTVCRVLLFSCFDRMNYPLDRYSIFLGYSNLIDTNNKVFILYQYYEFKYKNSNNRERLKYIKKNILDNIATEDKVIMKILLFEINKLAKETSNYQILQEFIETMGIVD